jgi:hypothetical protein
MVPELMPVKHVEDLATRNLVAQINQRFETVGTDYYLKGETAMGWSGHSLEAIKNNMVRLIPIWVLKGSTDKQISYSITQW